MEESDTEEELPLMSTSRGTSSRGTSRGTSVSEDQAVTMADISLQQAKQRRQLQICNLLTLSCVAALLATAVPLYYTDLDVLITHDQTTVSVDGFIIWLTFLCGYIIAGLVTPLLTAYLGIKNVLILGSITTSLYLCVSFIPSVVTMAPLALVAGLTTHAVHVSYLLTITQLSYLYLGTHLTNVEKTFEDLLHFFSGSFNTFFLGGPAVRAIFELLILPSGAVHYNTSTATMPCTDDYCDENKLPVFNLQHMRALLGLLLTLTVAALLLLTLCLSLKKRTENLGLTRTCNLFTFSAAKMLNSDFTLLLPLMFFIGMEETLVYHVLAKGVSCMLGWSMQQYLVVCVSAVAMMACLVMAILVTFVGRVKVVLLAQCMLLGLLITLLVWHPGRHSILYLIAALWGVADAVLRTQMLVLLRRVFQQHCVSAASCCTSVVGLGVLVTMLVQHFLCRKLCVVVALLACCLSLVTYTVYEIRQALLAREAAQRGDSSKLTLPDPSWLPNIDPITPGYRTSLFDFK